MILDKEGVIQVTTNHSFAETFELLESKVVSLGLIVFAQDRFSKRRRKS